MFDRMSTYYQKRYFDSFAFKLQPRYAMDGQDMGDLAHYSQYG
jgi:hypothetical protein